MLQFKQDDTSVFLLLTLSELKSISGGYYLFVFTHVLTKQVIAFVRSPADDLSDFPSRYNEFAINPSILFLDEPVGEWHYKVYEQESDTNTDPTASGSVLEYGKLLVDRETEFSYTIYESGTSFKTYNG